MATHSLEQQSLFPTRTSMEEVIAEAKAALPITNENQLIALLQLQQNTLLNTLTSGTEPTQ